MKLRFSNSFAGATVLTLLAGTHLLVACGGDDENEGKKNGLAGEGTDDIDIGDGFEDPNTPIADRDGGSEELSQQQAAAFQNASCTGWSQEGENLPATLQLVVDGSTSMDARAPGGGGSKWDVTERALSDAIEALPASMSVGMLHYPNIATADGGQCIGESEMTEIAQLGSAGSEHRMVISNSLNTATLNRGTPTYEAYKFALEAGLVPNQRANRFMLLITDGAPTIGQDCVFGVGGGELDDAPTQPIIDLIRSARTDHNIKTFLIGSPGSERSTSGGEDKRPWLSAAAIEGGTDKPGCSADGPDFCHLDMTQDTNFADSLTAGLASIVGQIVDSCTFAVPSPPSGETIDANKTNLVVTWGDGQSSLIHADGKGDCDVGWRFDDEGDIKLCEESCDKLKADRGASVQLTFGCTADELIETIQ